MKFLLFHVKYILLLTTVLASALVKGQGSIRMEDKVLSYSLPVDTGLQRILNASADYKKLSANDQQVAYYLNYARRNPKLFLDKAINVFVAGHPEVKSTYIGSLQATFKNLQPLGVIMPSAPISTVSLSHAADLRSHNTISHTSSDGRTFQQRVSSVVQVCASEAIHASMRYNPLEAVLSLLFDFNVPDLGHRKALLDPRFTKAGFGSSVAPNAFSVLVMDFSCQ
jgi:hypothetical protein